MANHILDILLYYHFLSTSQTLAVLGCVKLTRILAKKNCCIKTEFYGLEPVQDHH